MAVAASTVQFSGRTEVLESSETQRAPRFWIRCQLSLPFARLRKRKRKHIHAEPGRWTHIVFPRLETFVYRAGAGAGAGARTTDSGFGVVH